MINEQYLQENIGLHMMYSLFINKVGERVRMEYYTGVEAGNPSGSTTNIKYIHYETLDQPTNTWKRSMLKELTWNAADNILTTTVLAN